MNPPEMMFFVVTPSLHFVLILTKTTPTPTSLWLPFHKTVRTQWSWMEAWGQCEHHLRPTMIGLWPRIKFRQASPVMRSWEISARLQTEMKKTRGASGRSFNSRNVITAAEWYTFEKNIFISVNQAGVFIWARSTRSRFTGPARFSYEHNFYKGNSGRAARYRSTRLTWTGPQQKAWSHLSFMSSEAPGMWWCPDPCQPLSELGGSSHVCPLQRIRSERTYDENFWGIPVLRQCAPSVRRCHRLLRILRLGLPPAPTYHCQRD